MLGDCTVISYEDTVSIRRDKIISEVFQIFPFAGNLWTSGCDNGSFHIFCILQSVVLLLFSGSLWGRVEEQSLWSGRQLGEQSPAMLLRSLVYLNTKYFGLRTVEQHLRLSFANVYGPDTIHPVTKETTVCIRVPSISQGDHGEALTVEVSRSIQAHIFMLVYYRQKAMLVV